jgi:hypothetical protein
VLLATSLLYGQTPEPGISTDRPGFLNSGLLVGRGVFQVENGVRLFSEEAPGERVGVALDPNLRFGATNWLELRLSTSTVVLRSPQGPGQVERAVGASDLQVGIKVPVFAPEGGPLRVAAVVRTSVPSGHSTQTAGGYEPGTELIFEQELPGEYVLSGTWNVTRLKEERFTWNHAGSIHLGRSLGRTWTSFAEGYAAAGTDGGKSQWVLDAGLIKTVGSNFALDVWVARSVHGPRSWFIAFGVSRRHRLWR